MTRIPLALATAALLLASATPGAAQTYDSDRSVASAQGCAYDFYDPDMYNWFAIGNTCSTAIYVVVCRRDTGMCGSAATVRPGRNESFGMSRREVADRGGVEWLVCWDGYYPVDRSGSYKSRLGDGTYWCRRR